MTLSSVDPDVLPQNAQNAVDGDQANTVVVTASEKDPWVLLDLRVERTVSAVLVYDWFDYDQRRPVAVELSRDGRSFFVVAEARTDQATKDEATWERKFAPSQTRFVRLHLKRKGSLFVREIEVY